MMVHSGISLDIGAIGQQSGGPGMGAVPATPFDQLLATLDVGATTGTTATIVSTMADIPVSPGMLAPAAPASSAEITPQSEDDGAASDQDAPVATDGVTMAAPFVAPPLPIVAVIVNPAVAVARPVVAQDAPMPAAPPKLAALPVAAMVAPAGAAAGVQAMLTPVLEGQKQAALPADLLKSLGLVLADQPERKASMRAPAIELRQAVSAPSQPIPVQLAALQPASTPSAASAPAIGAAPAEPLADLAAVAATPAPVSSTAAQPLSISGIAIPDPASPSASVAHTAPVSDTAQKLGEQAMQARLDIADEARMVDRLARDIAQLSGNEGRLKFQLNPEHLGSLHVEVSRGAEGVSVRFGTETESARAMLSDAQHRLVNEARAQGMRIAETHVDLGGHQQGGSRGGQSAQSGQPHITTHGLAQDAAEPAKRAGNGAVERFA